jgi:hypothetical protein
LLECKPSLLGVQFKFDLNLIKVLSFRKIKRLFFLFFLLPRFRPSTRSSLARPPSLFRARASSSPARAQLLALLGGRVMARSAPAISPFPRSLRLKPASSALAAGPVATKCSGPLPPLSLLSLSSRAPTSVTFFLLPRPVKPSNEGLGVNRRARLHLNRARPPIKLTAVPPLFPLSLFSHPSTLPHSIRLPRSLIALLVRSEAPPCFDATAGAFTSHFRLGFA